MVAEHFKKFPINVRFAQDFVSAGDYKMDYDDYEDEGEINETFKTNLQISMPLYKNKTGYLSIGGFCNYHNAEFLPDDVQRGFVDMEKEHYMWGVQSAYVLSTKLKDKQVIGIINLKSEFSESGFERFTGIALGLMQLKRTEISSLHVGAVFLINTSSPWPLFPIVMYRHRLSEKYSFEFLMPRTYINYHISVRKKLSVGFSIDGEHFYITPKCPDLPKTCMYGRSNLRPEIKYEYIPNPLMKFYVKGGASICISSRLYSSSGNTRYVDISQKTSYFLGAGMSYGLDMF